MKKVFLLICAISMTALMSFDSKIEKAVKIELTNTTDYCEGWKDGYCEGYKDVKGQYSVCPVPPVCPVPRVGKNHYRGGYNRGFKAGMRVAYDD